MQNRRSARSFVLAASMSAIAACGAALFAHVGIDVAGDYVLPHDTYDGLAHGSRNGVLTLALGLALCSILWVVWVALEEVRGARGIPRITVDDLFGPGPWHFVLIIVALAFPILMAMECFDVTSSGSRIDDVSDLLGGSAALGSSFTVFAAALAALAVRHFARILLESQRAFASVIGQLIALLAPERPQGETRIRERGVGLQIGQRSILSRRFGKRGPPLRPC